MSFPVGEPTYQIRLHAMNSNSCGDALGSVGQANDQMWGSFRALPDIDEDSAEW